MFVHRCLFFDQGESYILIKPDPDRHSKVKGAKHDCRQLLTWTNGHDGSVDLLLINIRWTEFFVLAKSYKICFCWFDLSAESNERNLANIHEFIYIARQ